MKELKRILIEEVIGFREAGHKFLNGELNVAQFKGISGGMGAYAHRGGKEFMLRLRISSGKTDIKELKRIYGFAEKYKLPSIHLTTRQAIQLHGLELDDLCDLMIECLDYNIFTRGAGGNFPRNVSLSPLAGVDKNEDFDPTPYAIAVGKHFMKKINTYKLPRKLKVSFSGSEEDAGHAGIADLGFISSMKGGVKYFKVYVAGGLGNNPRKAIELKELVKAKDVLYYVEAITKLFINEGDYENKNKARIRYIAERLGEEAFVKLFNEYILEEKENSNLDLNIRSRQIKKEGSIASIKNKRLIAQKQAGLYSVYLHPIGGILKLQDLKKILDKIEKFSDIDIRLSMTEGIYFRNLDGEEAKDILKLTEYMGGNNLVEQSTACIGVPICQSGIANSQQLLNSIITYFREKDYKSDVLPRILISGCQNSCAVHQIGTIGFKGKKKKVGEEIQEVFSFYINGECKENSTKLGEDMGDILTTQIPEFLYLLASSIEKSELTFSEYMKEKKEDFETLINENVI